MPQLFSPVVVRRAVLAGLLALSTSPAFADGLTWEGITLYGTVDVAVAHQSHGAPLTANYAPGLPFVIQKFNDRPITSFVPNGLSQSKLGIAGDERIDKDLSVVFRLETGFLPTSLRLADGPKSLIVNNGRPLDQQITSGDSSRAGQLFQSAAYAGLASKRWGILTFGWQPTLLSDSIGRYDPQAASQAFSLIGYTGFTAGAGTTEDARFENALKWIYAAGPVRLGLMHQFGASDGRWPGPADEAEIGLDQHVLSLDFVYSHVEDAVSAASLSAAQNLGAPGTLAATVSDDTAYTIEARYTVGPAKLYAGYETILFANPDHSLAPGFAGIAGYRFSAVNDTAYTIHRKQRVRWTGARYTLNPKLALAAAYYRYDQNSFRGDGCADTSASSCRGRLEEQSVVADYQLSRRFDLYAGLSHSSVAGGLASGFLQSSTTSPTAGARFSF